jgi:hypothetical protein
MMNRADILNRLNSILTEYTSSADPYRYREMSSRGASDEQIGRDEGRSEGRDEVCDSIRELIKEIEDAPEEPRNQLSDYFISHHLLGEEQVLMIARGGADDSFPLPGGFMDKLDVTVQQKLDGMDAKIIEDKIVDAMEGLMLRDSKPYSREYRLEPMMRIKEQDFTMISCQEPKDQRSSYLDRNQAPRSMRKGRGKRG